MSANTLLMSVQMLVDRSGVHGNIDPKLVTSDIKAAQDMYIVPLLGSTLMDKLQTDIEADTLSGDYKTLVDEYVIDCLLWYVLSELPTGISYQFWNKGVLRSTNDSTETPTMQELLQLSDKYKKRAEHYAERLKLYLKEQWTKNAKFPEYGNPESGVDVTRPSENTFSSPIYLGDDENCLCHIKKYR